MPDPCRGGEVSEHWGGGVVVLVHENEPVLADPEPQRGRSYIRRVPSDQYGMDSGGAIAGSPRILVRLDVLPVGVDSGVLEMSHDSRRQMGRARSEHAQPTVVTPCECVEHEHQDLTVEPGHRRQE